MTWDDIRFFEPHEFDSPGKPGTGSANMKMEFVAALDEVRTACGFPLKVNSGFRTPEHNRSVGGVPDSAHVRGYAADIHAVTSRHRFAIVMAAMACGIKRVGVADTFVHLDMDPSRPERMLWVY